jgi:hypothetical protein
MEMKNLNGILYNLSDEFSRDIRTESISALRYALVDFLDDMEHLYTDVNTNDLCEISNEDYNSIRQMIKIAGELYLNIR